MTENGIYCNILAVNKVYIFNSCYCMKQPARHLVSSSKVELCYCEVCVHLLFYMHCSVDIMFFIYLTFCNALQFKEI